MPWILRYQSERWVTADTASSLVGVLDLGVEVALGGA